jgi:hypothetical protein
MFLNGNSGAEVYLDEPNTSKISNFDNSIITFNSQYGTMNLNSTAFIALLGLYY